jgi:hypothetical protein
VSDWSWEYLPTTEYHLGGLSPEQRRQVNRFGQRLADAADALYIGDPPIEESGVSDVQYIEESPWLIGYLTHRRVRVVYIVKVINLEAQITTE